MASCEVLCEAMEITREGQEKVIWHDGDGKEMFFRMEEEKKGPGMKISLIFEGEQFAEGFLRKDSTSLMLYRHEDKKEFTMKGTFSIKERTGADVQLKLYDDQKAELKFKSASQTRTLMFAISNWVAENRMSNIDVEPPTPK